jgi:hypothetical protein
MKMIPALRKIMQMYNKGPADARIIKLIINSTKA